MCGFIKEWTLSENSLVQGSFPSRLFLANVDGDSSRNVLHWLVFQTSDQFCDFRRMVSRVMRGQFKANAIFQQWKYWIIAL